MPVSRIGTLSQGEFIGKVADTFEHPIRQKLFCARIYRDKNALDDEMRHWRKLPAMMDFGEDEAEDNVRSNPRSFLMAHCKNEIQDGDIVYPDDLLDEKAAEMLEEMSTEEQCEMIDMIVEYERRRVCEKILDDNMMRIQNEVDSIVAAELMRLDGFAQNSDSRMTDPFHGL